MGILLKVESLVPRKISSQIQIKIGYTGNTHDTRAKVGFILLFPFIVGIATALVSCILLERTLLNLTAGYLLGVLFSFIAIYLLIDYQSMTRSRKIEDSLPDALELVAVNIGSGLTVENALVESARPEFGELTIFLKRAAKEMYSGSAIDDAFLEIGQRFDSEILHRSVLLITEGMRKGAALGDLLNRISNDLRGEAALKKDIEANVSMYVMLIIFATALGAPLLFGAGTVVSGIFAKQANPITADVSGGRLPLFGLLLSNKDKTNAFNASDIEAVSIVSIFLTAIFACMMIGVIKYNKETAGLRYFPFIIIVSIGAYYLGIFVLKKMVFGA
jgi:hypothetical protein